jgi:hypothetical protein
MAYAISPNSSAAWGLDGRQRLQAHVDLVNRSRGLIVSAFNSLLFRHAVDPELMEELRHIEAALSGARSSARSAVLVELRTLPRRRRP